MSLKPTAYKPRLIDAKVRTYLAVHGAISIEGPKWCGKTWTAKAHAESMVSLEERNLRDKIALDMKYAYTGVAPQLIDEWTRVPEIWDDVRRRCDDLATKGNFILTCSTRLPAAEEKEKVFHSGAGRIGRLMMRPMSLYEAGYSSGKASLTEMLAGTQENERSAKTALEELADYIVRGGWPSNLATTAEAAGILPATYIENVLGDDINRDKERNSGKMRLLMGSLARNESTVASATTLMRDISEGEGEARISVNTVEDYLDVLRRLYLVDDVPAFSTNYRSSTRLGKAAKRHLVDPSLPCALLGLSADKLLDDLRTFGLLFESLVLRDLKVYMDSLGGRVYHFRDNASGDEVDAILEFKDGVYAAVEVKLGENYVPEAVASLQKFMGKVDKKPAFACVVVGNGDFIVRDPATGVYIVPVTVLKP